MNNKEETSMLSINPLTNTDLTQLSIILIKIAFSYSQNLYSATQFKMTIFCVILLTSAMNLKFLPTFFPQIFDAEIKAISNKSMLFIYFLLEILGFVNLCDNFLACIAIIVISQSNSYVGNKNAFTLFLLSGIIKSVFSMHPIFGLTITFNLEEICITLICIAILKENSKNTFDFSNNTQNKESDLLMKSNEMQKYQEIVNNVSFPVFLWDSVQNKIIWNNLIGNEMIEKFDKDFIERTIVNNGNICLTAFISSLTLENQIITKQCVIQNKDSAKFVVGISKMQNNYLLCFTNISLVLSTSSQENLPVKISKTVDHSELNFPIRLLNSVCDEIKNSRFQLKGTSVPTKNLLYYYADLIQDYVRVFEGSFSISKSVFEFISLVREVKAFTGVEVLVAVSKSIPIQIFSDYQRIIRIISGLIRVLLNGALFSIIHMQVTYSTKTQEIYFSLSEEQKGLPPSRRRELQKILDKILTNSEISTLSNTGVEFYTTVIVAEKMGTKIILENLSDFGTRFLFAIRQPKKSVSARLNIPAPAIESPLKRCKTTRLSTFAKEAKINPLNSDSMLHMNKPKLSDNFSNSDSDNEDVPKESEAQSIRHSFLFKPVKESTADLNLAPIYHPKHLCVEAKGKYKRAASCLINERSGVRKILIADDNNVNRALMRELFEKLGYSSRESNNGVEALNMIEQEHFDCIFMDISMPVMDGLTASRRIRQYEESHFIKPVPIIAMSGMYGPEIIEKSYDSGINEVILRPISLSSLKECINRHLQTK